MEITLDLSTKIPRTLVSKQLITVTHENQNSY